MQECFYITDLYLLLQGKCRGQPYFPLVEYELVDRLTGTCVTKFLSVMKLGESTKSGRESPMVPKCKFLKS